MLLETLASEKPSKFFIYYVALYIIKVEKK